MSAMYSLEKGRRPLITSLPFTKGLFESSIVEIGHVVLEKNILYIYKISSLLSPLGKRHGPIRGSYKKYVDFCHNFFLDVILH